MAGVQNINIDISDTNTMQYVYAVKNDVGRTINFIIDNNGTSVDLTGSTGTFIISKNNGSSDSISTINNGNISTITETVNETSLVGVHKFELKIVNSSNIPIVDVDGYYVVVPDVISNTSIINEYSTNLIDLLITEFASLKVNMDHLYDLETDLILRNGGDISNTITENIVVNTNLIKTNIADGTYYGVTFTNQDNGTLLLNGKCDTTSTGKNTVEIPISDDFEIPNNTSVVTVPFWYMCTANNTTSTYAFLDYYYGSVRQYCTIKSVTSSPIEVTNFATKSYIAKQTSYTESDLKLKYTLGLCNGDTFNNVVIYPMVSLSEITGKSDYQKYGTDDGDSWKTVSSLQSGEKTSVSMGKISKMIANIKYLEKLYEALSFTYDSSTEDLKISMTSIDKE